MSDVTLQPKNNCDIGVYTSPKLQILKRKKNILLDQNYDQSMFSIGEKLSMLLTIEFAWLYIIIKFIPGDTIVDLYPYLRTSSPLYQLA